MQFSDILGQDYIKNHLTKSVLSGRIPHAQLFIGPEGCGTLAMAIAYAQFVLCNNQGQENDGGNESCNLKFLSLSHPDLHFVYPNVTNEDVKTKSNKLPYGFCKTNSRQSIIKSELFGFVFTSSLVTLG